MMLRYRGDTDRAIRECARQRAAALSTGQIIAAIRATAGSRRHNFGVTYREALIDILVHAQDVAIPVGRRHPMPPEAAAAAVTRIWTMRWPPPFPASRTMQQFQVTATDTASTAGHGPQIQAPINAILLLSAGRLAALPELAGDGAAELTARLTASCPAPRTMSWTLTRSFRKSASDGPAFPASGWAFTERKPREHCPFTVCFVHRCFGL